MDHQLGDFAKSQPNTRISLVTFNNEVTIFGDGKNDGVVVTGDKLNDHDALVKVGTEASLPASIKDIRKSLGAKLFRYIHMHVRMHVHTHTHTHMCVLTYLHVQLPVNLFCARLKFTIYLTKSS